MGCGKSKHAVASGNTVSKSKSSRSDSIQVENRAEDPVQDSGNAGKVKDNVVVDAVVQEIADGKVVKDDGAVEVKEENLATSSVVVAKEGETAKGEEKQEIKKEADCGAEEEEENLNSSDSPQDPFQQQKRDREEAQDQSFTSEEISEELPNEDLPVQNKTVGEELNVDEGKEEAVETVDVTTAFAATEDQEISSDSNQRTGFSAVEDQEKNTFGSDQATGFATTADQEKSTSGSDQKENADVTSTNDDKELNKTEA